MKDRAAILTSGHATKGAFWVDHDTGAWETSTYWMKELPHGQPNSTPAIMPLPRAKKSGVAKGSFYELVGRSAASVSYQLDFAEALIAGEKLGQNPAERHRHDHDFDLLDRYQWSRIRTR
jgi:hypothetical protein